MINSTDSEPQRARGHIPDSRPNINPVLNLDENTRDLLDRLMAEVQLLSLGHIVPLKFTVNLGQLESELEAYRSAWIDYLPRPDRVNNRKGLCLFGLPGDSLRDSLSLPEANSRTGRRLTELDFNTPTELYHHCKSLHPLFDFFMPVGRSFFVKCNKGGWFHPHRDHPQLFRDTMRVIVFCKNSKSHEYDWLMDGRKCEFEEGRAYYVNTRLVHKTVSYTDDSIHLIMNIPVTAANASKIVEALHHFY